MCGEHLASVIDLITMKSNYFHATLLALTVQATFNSSAQPLTIEAESGVISAPFAITNGYVYQPVHTGVTNGGCAVYDFTITNAGRYAILATVNSPDASSNSFFVRIDGEPQNPASVWAFSTKTGFTEQMVTSQEGISPSSHVYALAQGTHQLVVRGRGANARLDRLAIVKVPESPPAPPSNLRIVADP